MLRHTVSGALCATLLEATMTEPGSTVPSDLAISRAAVPRPLEEVAADMGIGAHLLEPYGNAAAKVSLDAIDELADRPRAKYVVVSAITPTPLGSGKTTTSVGLGQGFKHIGKDAVVAIRQPSMEIGRASGRDKSD